LDSSISISVSLVTRLLGNQELRVWVPAGARDYSLYHHIRAISGTYPSPHSVYMRFLSLCVVKLTTHLHLVARIWLHWAEPPLTFTPSWHGA
jgi:hypothetical protein